MRVFTAEQMNEIDRRAIEDLGIPSLVLMENAAVGLADALGVEFPDVERVAILCGPGNNGADGLALARHLDGRGYRLDVFLLSAKEPAGDPARQLAILEAAGLAVHRPAVVAGAAETEGLSALCAAALSAAHRADLVVDALFGTGLSRPLGGPVADLVTALDGGRVPILAVDLPSGLGGGQAEPLGPYLTADVTVTFAAPKVAQILPPAADACGRLTIVDLGLPAGVLEAAPGDLQLTTADVARSLAPERSDGRDTNKGTFGHTLVVAGGAGTAGAAVLATRAAVRSGAGLVTAAVPSAIRAEVDLGSLESMTLAVDLATSAGVDALIRAAEGKASLAVGPGLGTDDRIGAVVRRLLAEIDVPLVLDADALTVLAGDLEPLRDRAAAERATVLTPHPGEMGRLLGRSTAEVQGDRLATVRAAVDATRAVVILKGRRSLVSAPDGGVWIDPTGNSGLATGGTGDVLTGLVAGLLAQGVPALDAARLGASVHGTAGDLAAERIGRRALAAGDVVDSLGAAWRHLLGDAA